MGVFADPLPRNELHDIVVLLLRACMLRTLPIKGSFYGHCLAMGLYATLSNQRPLILSLAQSTLLTTGMILLCTNNIYLCHNSYSFFDRKL
jgi:hypothetical protein